MFSFFPTGKATQAQSYLASTSVTRKEGFKTLTPDDDDGDLCGVNVVNVVVDRFGVGVLGSHQFDVIFGIWLRHLSYVYTGGKTVNNVLALAI
jgi:hypothetical protein